MNNNELRQNKELNQKNWNNIKMIKLQSQHEYWLDFLLENCHNLFCLKNHYHGSWCPFDFLSAQDFPFQWDVSSKQHMPVYILEWQNRRYCINQHLRRHRNQSFVKIVFLKCWAIAKSTHKLENSKYYCNKSHWNSLWRSIKQRWWFWRRFLWIA